MTFTIGENATVRALDGVEYASPSNLKLPPVAILAGGRGTRLSEETQVRPKPLVEIGGFPVIWHIMKHYDSHGMKEFAIALGYKKEAIIRYFLDLHATSRNLTVRTRDGSIELHEKATGLDWTIHLIDTGSDTGTGGRMKRMKPWLGKGTFMMTFCDGVSDIDLSELLSFHRAHGKLATVTVVRAPSRFGVVTVAPGGIVRGFAEKPKDGGGWINAAFFVLEPGVFDYIDGDDTMWVDAPMERLASDGQLVAHRHESFWQCMDTLRERDVLDDLWRSGQAPWKTWE